MSWICQHCGKENVRRRQSPKGTYAHGLKRYTYNKCRCDICMRAKRTRDQRYAQHLRDAVPNTHRHGYEWTGPELELVGQRLPDGSYRLTAREAALAVGRTVKAVKGMRGKILHAESREDVLAGLPRKAAS